MKDLLGACNEHPDDWLLVEPADEGGLVAVCLKCPRKIKLCCATKHMAVCILPQGHETYHRTYQGTVFE